MSETKHEQTVVWVFTRQLERELNALRKIVSDIATAIGNGSAVSEQASVEFMQEIPKELAFYTKKLRAELERVTKERDELKNQLHNTSTALVAAGQICTQLEKERDTARAQRDRAMEIAGLLEDNGQAIRSADAPPWYDAVNKHWDLKEEIAKEKEQG